MASFRILYQDADHVAVDKPYGVHVHPPEDERHRIPYHENGMAILRDQLGQLVYPVHRLDRPTSGVVLYALSSEAAGILGKQFAEQKVEKTYAALVRGWMKDEKVRIDSPLSRDIKKAEALDKNGAEEADALTYFERLACFEMPWPSASHETSRYSIVLAKPKTGRMHQIRRHLRRQSLPIIGDSVHGDGIHNRLFQEWGKRRYLFLKAMSLEWSHPRTGERLIARSNWSGDWHQVFDQAGVCAWASSIPQAD